MTYATVLFAQIMLSPFTIILWLVILAGVLIAVVVHFTLASNGLSVSLADLTSIKPVAGQMDRWLETVRESTNGVSIELILYGVLSAIGLLLIMRAIASAIIVYRQRNRLGPAISGLPRSLDLSSAADEGDGLVNGLGSHRSFPGRGLSAKMLLAFTGTVLLFGLCTAAVVYFTLMNSLREHQLKRAEVLAQNVSDVAVGYMVQKKPDALRDLLRKSTGTPATAYIIVEDRQGAVAAHNLAELPNELQLSHDLALSNRTHRRTLTVAARPVYETVVPLLDGQAGAVRVGLWAQEVEAETRRIVVPVVYWILAVIAGGLLCAIYLVWRINRPIVRLVRIASHISRGALDIPLVGNSDPSEFGELSRALERLRSSVKAAMARLD